MRAKPDGCKNCAFEKIGQGFVIPEGKGATGVALVGEGSGRNEARDGLPFRPFAESGSLLEKVFKGLKRTRNDFRLMNVISCRPPGDDLKKCKQADAAIEHCSRYLNARLEAFKPKAIVALGGTALKALTGVEGITQHRGYVWNTRYGYVVGALHPAYIRRGKSQLLPTLVYDIQKALRIAYGQFTEFDGHPSYSKPDYCINPGVDTAISFRNRVRDNAGLLLTYDIENPESGEAEETEREDLDPYQPLVQIQFSLGMREGIAFPWEEPYIGIAKEILSYQNMKLGHNIWMYDNPVLKALYDIRPAGVLHDSLAMFHHMHPDLEAGLQKAVSLFDFPFPWKHLAGTDLAWYGCADVDAPHWIWNKLPEQMKARGVWDGYLKMVAGFYPILVNMQDRGVGVNKEYREEFRQLVEKKRDEADAELQAAIPIEIKNPHPKLGYKKVPGEVTEAIERWTYYRALFEQEGKQMVTPLAEYVRSKTEMEEREFEVKLEDLSKAEREIYAKDESGTGVVEHTEPNNISTTGDIKGANRDTGDIKRVRRWCRVKQFSARSSQQVVRYIRWAGANDPAGRKRTKHIVPLTLKEQKETTAKEEIERLYFNTGDPVYKLVVEYREYSKILSTDLPQWEPNQKTGRVHTSFTMAPASGQLSSRAPNVQNVVKHTKSESFRFKREIELGKAFRKMIVPAPGRVLMEFDKSAFHVVMLGREAKSTNYMRIARADMHSFFASHLIGRHNKAVKPIDPSLPFDELKEQCKWIKKNFKGVRDTKAKPTILGVGLGLGAMKLWHTNRENIEGPSEAKDLLAMIRELFPEVFAFQDRVRKEAYERHLLVSPWGFCRTFYDVFTKRKDRCGKWKLVPGTDSEKAIAFFVQSNAFGMMRSEMKRLERMQANLRFWLVNTVHDSLIYEPKIKDVEYCYEVVTGVMNSACKVLADQDVCPDGLVVNVDCQIGENWGEMKEFKL